MLGTKVASNIEKTRIFWQFFKYAKYGLDPVPDLDPEPEPETFPKSEAETVINHYGSTTLDCTVQPMLICLHLVSGGDLVK
jgi:hypothetical protein